MPFRQCLYCGSISDAFRTVHAADCPAEAAMTTSQRVAAAFAQGHTKMAAFPPFSKNGPPPPPPAGGGAPEKRNIPQDHPFDPRALKPMAKALWAASVAHGHALTAYRHISRLKSATVSPDGMVGGRGYIMKMTDMRQRLYEACESLSAITDTLHDEIGAPHWQPKLAQLDDTDKQDVERFVEESQDWLAQPEDEAEEEIDEIEGKKEPEASQIPTGGPADESEAQPPKAPGGTDKQASAGLNMLAWAPEYDAPVVADSSVPPDSLPGPRVDSLDRGEQTGPWGSFNVDETPSDDWFEDGEREYDYPSEWENDLREANGSPIAESAVPDSDTDDTPTDAWDFGLGYGAKGDGAGRYENPSGEGSGGKGVWGPHSGLPGSPSTSVNDTTPIVDVTLNERHALLRTLLPGDTDEPVARSDYFPGWKGNLVQSESGLPGEATPGVENHPPAIDTEYVQEDAETPYSRYDYGTHTYREDPLHNWPQEKLPENIWPQQG